MEFYLILIYNSQEKLVNIWTIAPTCQGEYFIYWLPQIYFIVGHSTPNPLLGSWHWPPPAQSYLVEES